VFTFAPSLNYYLAKGAKGVQLEPFCGISDDYSSKDNFSWKIITIWDDFGKLEDPFGL
jgi:hypothetical protein